MNTNTAEKLEEGTEVELENNVELEVDIIDDTPEQDTRRRGCFSRAGQG